MVKEESQASKFSFPNLQKREGASPGIWLSLLLPVACGPGIYSAYSHCQPSPYILSFLAFQTGANSAYILIDLCKQQSDTSVPPTKSFMYKYVTHSLMSPVICVGALLVLTNSSPFLCIISAFTTYWLQTNFTKWLFHNFGRSFTIGEGLLAGQAATLVVVSSFHYLCLLPTMGHTPSERWQMSAFIQLAILVAGGLCATLWFFPMTQRMKTFIPLLCAAGIVGVGVSSLALSQWVPLWLFTYLLDSPTRVMLIAWWGSLSLFSIIFTSWAQRYQKLARTVIRKVYHVVIVLVFLPGLLYDQRFTSLAASAAFILLIILELVRFLGIQPLSNIISNAFDSFLDDKDSGNLILSHIYLLAGIAAPMWLIPCGVTGSTYRPTTSLPVLAGILSVGIGDTVASVGGTYLGRHKWPGTKKTVEGSVLSVLAQVALIMSLNFSGCLIITSGSWPRIIAALGLTALVEAFTDQVDNIVLPLILYIPLIDP